VISYTACAVPSSPITSGYTGKTATLKWRQVPCAAEYYVEYAKSSSSTWTTVTVSGSADTTYKLTGLAQSTSYKWQVASVCTTKPSVIASAYTSSVTFKTTSATSDEPGDSSIAASYKEPAVLPVDGNEFDAVVYPNPAVNTANIIISGLSGKVIIMVTDLSGRVVWQNESTAVKQVILPVANLSAGMYFITVKDERHIKTLKLLKQ
jgi:hypothetical protein